MAAPRDSVYVVVVNWNGWRDTIECLESVFQSRCHVPFRVVVCDNGSTDGSLESIQRWANGELAIECGPAHPFAGLAASPLAKPIAHRVLSRADAERTHDEAPLTVIAAGTNLGFAGGCNIGVRYALRRPDCSYVWLLNNDTVVDPGALAAVVRRLEARSDAGQCGSRILSYDEPAVIQARGGEHYNRWLARSTPIGAGRPADERVDVSTIERGMSYIVGAALCVTRRFVETVGLLDESYFLYGEELDWLARAGGRFALLYAHDSIVYHKEGGTIGSSRNGASRSSLGDYFMVRSRLRFTWRHARVAFPTVALGVLIAGINRIRRRQFDRAVAILRILLSRDTYSPTARGVPPESLSQRPAARER